MVEKGAEPRPRRERRSQESGAGRGLDGSDEVANEVLRVASKESTESQAQGGRRRSSHWATSVVFPKPGGADTRVTRCSRASSRRSRSRGRSTKTGFATGRSSFVRIRTASEPRGFGGRGSLAPGGCRVRAQSTRSPEVASPPSPTDGRHEGPRHRNVTPVSQSSRSMGRSERNPTQERRKKPAPGSVSWRFSPESVRSIQYRSPSFVRLTS